MSASLSQFTRLIVLFRASQARASRNPSILTFCNLRRSFDYAIFPKFLAINVALLFYRNFGKILDKFYFMKNTMSVKHIAIIMDGNGRWAQAKGLPRVKGHEAGAQNVRRIMKAAKSAGVKYLTLYAFSVENWNRPKLEVEALMRLLKHFLSNYEQEFHENKIRLRIMGRKTDLPSKILKEIERVEEATSSYADYTLIIALSYGGRVELVNAAKKLAERVESGELKASEIDEKSFMSELYLPDVPDPDLIIRTSGEFRVSNFLLWQCAYSEFYITPICWPDFDEAELNKAIASFDSRDRRFGGLKNIRGTVIEENK